MGGTDTEGVSGGSWQWWVVGGGGVNDSVDHKKCNEAWKVNRQVINTDMEFSYLQFDCREPILNGRYYATLQIIQNTAALTTFIVKCRLEST